MELESCNDGGEEVINGWNWKNSEELTYNKYMRKMFKDVVREILQKFNERNNYELISSLKRYIKEKHYKKSTV
jgi:AAA+ ATPase superfamily predicted ATPase